MSKKSLVTFVTLLPSAVIIDITAQMQLIVLCSVPYTSNYILYGFCLGPWV